MIARKSPNLSEMRFLIINKIEYKFRVWKKSFFNSNISILPECIKMILTRIKNTHNIELCRIYKKKRNKIDKMMGKITYKNKTKNKNKRSFKMRL